MDRVGVVGGAAAEVRVLVVAGGDRDVQFVGAAEQFAVGGDQDRGVEAEAVVGPSGLSALS